MHIPLACVTFDQPLWLKATGIVEDAKLNVVCCLGGFHTLMSFLGSIGQMMRDSVLEELFAEVYAEHRVVHMLSGKAVSGALRAHFLAQSALVSLIIMKIRDEGALDSASARRFLESLTVDNLMQGFGAEMLSPEFA